ncbi:F-box only protein 5 [Betta splendens]|uniref:F-box only protein 5 n=1 Tax=Betta splendens TaxID=158456 RepID=A0A6P7KM94_BETSP|nr:F-box only protein 5 [Betta splendens]
MKCPHYETNRGRSTEKAPAADAMVFRPKASTAPVKRVHLPADVTVLFTDDDSIKAVHDKENDTSRDHDRTLEKGLEDSGYLSLQNSQLDEHHGDEEDEHTQAKPTSALLVSVTQPGKTTSNSPSKCRGRKNPSHPAPLVTASTPVDRPRRRAATCCLSSTPADKHTDPNLPILNFQQDVCEELVKSYRKNKRYDWSVVGKVAESHLLDRVIGRQMGLEFVDMFTSLLSRNMRSILADILALLGDMDLIRCKKVSRTWRRVICDDPTALRRCQRQEEALRESTSSRRAKLCGLTREVAVSRVVLSCMQTLASSNTQSASSSSSTSSTPSCKLNRRSASSQKGNTPTSQCTRFKEFMQAASGLKQHESLRHCKRCGSPATHSAEAQRATCTRSSCLYDFCTRCQETFHGSTPCRTVQPRTHFVNSRTTPITPGSTRSKRNVRRL